MICSIRIRISVLLLLLVVISTFGQEPTLVELKDKDYSKAERKLTKEYVKNSEDLLLNYNLSILYNSPDFSGYLPDTAYYFIKRAESLYTGLPQKQREKLIKNSINLSVLRAQTDLVCSNLFGKYVDTESVSIGSANYFINRFRDNRELVARAIKIRDTIAFYEVCKSPSIGRFNSFMADYPQSSLNGEATQRRDELLFADAEKTGTASALYSFAKSYPKSHLYKKAMAEYDKLYFQETVDFSLPQSLMDFIYKNNESSYREVAFDSLYVISSKNTIFEGLDFYVRYNPNGKYAGNAWREIYKWITQDGRYNSFQLYSRLYLGNLPNQEEFQRDLDVATLGEGLKLENGYDASQDSAYWNYIRRAGNRDYAFKTLQVMISPKIKAKDWAGALSVVDKALPFFTHNSKWILALKDALSTPNDGVKIENLGSKVNSNEGSEYVPVVTADGKRMYFCGLNRKDNFSGEDIFVSEFSGGWWQPAKLVQSLATDGNDAPESVSTDGNTLSLFINGDVYYSERSKYGWESPQKFPSPINTDAWEGDGALTSDGKALLFVSERDNDSNAPFKSRDIYVSVKGEKGWEAPINLGKVINTKYEERSPYLHYDMKTLYFSSIGHGGFGSYDVFVSRRLSDTSWTQWSEPVNLGKEINTAGMDWNYKINTVGDKAYFSIDKSNNKHKLYSATLPQKVRPLQVAALSGVILGLDRVPQECTIRWEDLESGLSLGESKTSPIDGSYYMVFPLGKHYGYHIEKEGFFPVSGNIDLTNQNVGLAMEDTIVLPFIDKLVSQAIPIPLNNLFFDVDKDVILHSSYSELDRIVEIMKKKNLGVEISGHTDNSGSKEHNQVLSESRAHAVANYLMDKGIFERVITTIGYGDSRPIAPNSTDSGKAKNRRVEIKFIKL